HASRESRPGPDITRGDGNRARLVPPCVAPSRWYCRPLRCAECSYRVGAVVALSAPSLPSSSLGSTPTPARAEHPAAPRGPYRRDSSVTRLVQHLGLVHASGPGLLAVPS